MTQTMTMSNGRIVYEYYDTHVSLTDRSQSHCPLSHKKNCL